MKSSPTLLRVSLRGELDLSCGGFFDCLFDLDVSPRQTVVIDLRDLTFCDVAGVNALTGLRDYFVHLGRTVELVHLAPHIARLMELLQATERLTPSRPSLAAGDWWDASELT